MNDQLIKTVEDTYGLSILSFDILQKTPRTHVAKINTIQRKYVLKRMYITESRLRFILQIEAFLREQNINIPQIIQTKENRPYFLLEGYPCILQEWISGEVFQFSLDQSIQQIGNLLGKMHVLSLGFHSSTDDTAMLESSMWENEYQDTLKYMVKWANLMKNTQNPKKTIILESIDFFINTGKELEKQIIHHPYHAIWKKKPLHEHYLSHGDFQPKNILMSSPEWCIIDWEFARHDFPSRDCMEIIYKMTSYENRWDSEKFNIFLSSYLSQNQLTNQELSFFYLDFAFPHYYGRFLKNWRYTKMSTREIREFIKREQEKTNYMLQQFKIINLL
ncbi:phosphotransferase [Bacillus sp. AFS017274]|uniref:phosphotransferase n=1 Tax=Bacillaceae TaxID=186817 RepID=UPI000BF51A2A|nr:phosphotransferase [Bacillus sp. AFS017274]PEZ78408.1 hypothetical protein CN380_18370 [Bacillus sp. AFS017274]